MVTNTGRCITDPTEVMIYLLLYQKLVENGGDMVCFIETAISLQSPKSTVTKHGGSTTNYIETTINQLSSMQTIAENGGDMVCFIETAISLQSPKSTVTKHGGSTTNYIETTINQLLFGQMVAKNGGNMASVIGMVIYRPVFRQMETGIGTSTISSTELAYLRSSRRTDIKNGGKMAFDKDEYGKHCAFCVHYSKNEPHFTKYLMSTLPIELWRLIASTNIQTYHVLAQVVRDLCEVCPAGATTWEDYFTTMEVDANDVQFWKLHGKLHRGGDLPAKIHASIQSWYQYGKLHRYGDKPAVIQSIGIQTWYQHGKVHRDGDKPAVTCPSGHQEWYHDGMLHRDNDQPAICHANGMRRWYQRGELHRYDDKPAVTHTDGQQEWWQHGKLHRDNDKPAVICPDGVHMWWLEGKLIKWLAG